MPEWWIGRGEGGTETVYFCSCSMVQLPDAQFFFLIMLVRGSCLTPNNSGISLGKSAACRVAFKRWAAWP